MRTNELFRAVVIGAAVGVGAGVVAGLAGLTGAARTILLVVVIVAALQVSRHGPWMGRGSGRATP